ncbi:type II toxin-antitoxin system VapC family toxin [Nostoc sp. CHAB 5715]|uniref:type II toxin-antitoxin system VapC family toxin n=1 Tax=Nostoc sp. CHAB 5715 TaxID=2780400 RepID=UPI001E31B80C|nr:type II toxin-antitoxin system VapC family toxin [Nostoc sp. CHAB 5715]MCC5623104.1 type II toxin-antitoxin system VapC family toxin [Nostoc sp. CHAB 5715]
MKFLLDTHTFIWWDSDSKKLSERVLELLLNPENVRLVSVVSLWEIQIKTQLGKLTLNQSLPDIIHQQQNNGIEFIGVKINHVLMLGQLPLHHKDPFDRLLISQAQSENAILISKDTNFSSYSVSVEW